MLTFQLGSVAPVVGFSATMAVTGCPLAWLKGPPATTSPLGRVARALTCSFSTGRNDETQSPVLMLNAARNDCCTCPVPAASCCTYLKLPPTYMLLPDWVKA